MPHAVSPSADEAVAPQLEDSELPDAPAATMETSDEKGDEGVDSQTTDPATQDSHGVSTKLEDMFDDDDDDDDDEFSSSAPTDAAAANSQTPAAPRPNFCEPDVLRQYYSRLLPFRPLFQWLNHSPTPQPDFQNREFAFQLPGGAYVRYQSFATADLLRKQCVQMTPERFEIGPQYSVNPRDRKSLRSASAFRPVMKELVFDIDLTDYDPVRTCCRGAAICPRCWRFVVMAVRVVDAALRDDFAFRHILWVYSGRRGAHAWVSDKRAREMDDTQRKAIANYLVLAATSGEPGKRSGGGAAAAIRRPLHPHLDRSLRLLNPHFATDVLEGQDPWRTPTQAEALLALLPDAGLTAALRKKWDSAPEPTGRPSAQKWADIDALAAAGHLTTLSARQLVDAKQDARLAYTYPRLDAEVSKKRNHLLKAPFVVHPGTGRVCVPIDPRRLDAFDPFAVPTVTELLREIDEWDARNAGMAEEERARWQDWQKTSVRPYVEYFRGYVAGLLKEEGKGKREREEGSGAGGESMEF